MGLFSWFSKSAPRAEPQPPRAGPPPSPTPEEAWRDAIGRRDAQSLVRLIEEVSDIDMVGPQGRTALMVGARSDAALVEALLNRGAELDSSDAFGWTALFYAAYDFNMTGFEMLLEKGADPDRANEEGLTVLMQAVGWCREAVDRLIAVGADIEATDKRGMTPLMHAAQSGTLDAVKALIAAGADVARTDNRGNTALALVSGPLTKAEALRSAGVPANVLVEVECICLLPERYSEPLDEVSLRGVLQRCIEIISDRVSPDFGVDAQHRSFGAFTSDPALGAGIVITWKVTPQVQAAIVPATRTEWEELIEEFDRHGIEHVLASPAGRV